MKENNCVEVKVPQWAGGRTLNEEGFCNDFLLRYPMKFCDGSFFTAEGLMTEEEVRSRIYATLQGYVLSDISLRTGKLLEVLKLRCHVREMPIQETLLHCANGTYDLTRDAFTPEKQICRFRLPVNFNRDCALPERWFSFLDQLLYEEDIPTLQEFLGYCLLPVNYAQKMLLILGNGGEGKSRIGVVLSALLGDYMVNGSLAKLERSPFARADLQNRLVMVDDDLQLEALNSTGHLKSLITAEQKMDLEKKNVQSYQGRVFCRFLAFGNGSLRSLHDRSHGFFRRQIILTTRPLDPQRKDDPFLARRIIREELEGILMWALEGALRLIGNDMQIWISPRAKENLRSAIAEGNNLPDFLRSTGYLRFDSEGCISSRHLYGLYRDWCEDNALIPLSARAMSTWLLQNLHQYDLRYANNIPGGNGRLVRGFRGIRSVI